MEAPKGLGGQVYERSWLSTRLRSIYQVKYDVARAHRVLVAKQAPVAPKSATMVGTHRRSTMPNQSEASGGCRQAHLPSVPCGPRARAGDAVMEQQNGIAWWVEGGL